MEASRKGKQIAKAFTCEALYLCVFLGFAPALFPFPELQPHVHWGGVRMSVVFMQWEVPLICIGPGLEW